MKVLACEICGSNDLVKQEGLFVCQYCGAKYSLEEARKMMVEGTVRIDHSSELTNLYKAARNAREASDEESAIRHYEKISGMDPDSWEATFYLVILRTENIKNNQIESSAINVQNCLPRVFKAIKETVHNDEERKKIIWEVARQCHETATWLTSASHSFYSTVTKGSGLMALTGIMGAISSASSVGEALNEDSDRCLAAANILCVCGNTIEKTFDMNDTDYRSLAVWCWTKMMNFHTEYSTYHTTQTLFSFESVQKFNGKIAQYSMAPGAQPNNIQNTYAPVYTQAPVNTPAPPPMNAPMYAPPPPPINPNLVPLTIHFDGNAGGFSQLAYSIDNGPKITLYKKGFNQHPLPFGNHVISVLNPMMKREHRFVLNGPLSIKVYSKSFGVEFTEE